MSPTEPQCILHFENVWLKLDNVDVLKGVTFSLRQGETRILFGAAGAGKTVLLKVALGLLKPTRGEVYLFNQNITHMTEDQLFAVRPKVGILFQESALFDSLTIRDNVAYPLRNQRGQTGKLSEQEIESKVREALRFVELEQTLDRFPAELSGGMRRRVGIARASVTHPALILYDSPTAGLDPVTSNTIMALVVKDRDTRQGTAMIVTHRYQDGDIMANFQWDTQNGRLHRVSRMGAGGGLRTRFMVFKQGELVFEGTQLELENSTDSYVANFARHEGKTNGNRS